MDNPEQQVFDALKAIHRTYTTTPPGLMRTWIANWTEKEFRQFEVALRWLKILCSEHAQEEMRQMIAEAISAKRQTL
jgi:hypothetical protein